MVGDVLEHELPRRRLPLWLRLAVGAVGLVALGTVIWVVKHTPERRLAPSPDAAFALPADRIVALSLVSSLPGTTLERRDPTATDGPWTVIVRRGFGSSFGLHSAVVTFPVSDPGVAPRRTFAGVTGVVAEGVLVWAISGRYARIRGALSLSELALLAAHTSIVGDHPVVEAPPGFSIAASEPYRPAIIDETRYDARDVDSSLSGLLYAGVLRGGGFEDTLYAGDPDPAGSIHGQPAIASQVFGGSRTVAWELAPGTVAYVGYSGSIGSGSIGSGSIGSGTADSTTLVETLRQIAANSVALNEKEWRATQPRASEAINDFP